MAGLSFIGHGLRPGPNPRSGNRVVESLVQATAQATPCAYPARYHDRLGLQTRPSVKHGATCCRDVFNITHRSGSMQAM